MLDPPAAMDKLVAVADVRADRPTGEMLVGAMLGGAYLSFGASLFVMVAGGSVMAAQTLPGLHALGSALVFPTGLSMIVLTGSDLLTSNMMYATLPFLGSKREDKDTAARTSDAAKLLGVSFAGNFASSLVIAGAVSSWVLMPGSPGATWVAALALKKCSLGYGAMIGKGIGANWLVNLAVFQATTATSTGGKIAAVWMPVTAFVALGLEHSVANMFLLPLGILSGADLSMLDVMNNVVPVSIGNAIGAGLFVGGAQWYALGGARR